MKCFCVFNWLFASVLLSFFYLFPLVQAWNLVCKPISKYLSWQEQCISHIMYLSAQTYEKSQNSIYDNIYIYYIYWFNSNHITPCNIHTFLEDSWNISKHRNPPFNNLTSWTPPEKLTWRWKHTRLKMYLNLTLFKLAMLVFWRVSCPTFGFRRFSHARTFENEGSDMANPVPFGPSPSRCRCSNQRDEPRTGCHGSL